MPNKSYMEERERLRREEEKQSALRKARAQEDIKELLKLPAGRRFLLRILESCYMFKTTFTGNSTTYLNEGMRNVGLKIQDEISEVDPMELFKLYGEFYDSRNTVSDRTK